jgi:N-acetylneuraminate synthase/N,N'-diacetyllegionaminate synthase
LTTQGVVRIGPKEIGRSVIVVAEAGVNHCGSLGRALRMVDEAARAGADAIKFQTYIAEKVASNRAPRADYQVKTARGKTQLEMLKSLELSRKDFVWISRRARMRGIVFFSTPFDYESVDLLEALEVPAYKVGSGEITNLPFLEYMAKKAKPIIVSTGMSYLDEVGDAVSAIRKQGNDRIVLLHCVSSYPADPAESNLRAMQTLREAFGVPVGFSDHTTGIEVALAAAALGAVIIEKHFTLSRRLPGPDQKASLEPKEFKKMVEGIRLVERAQGSSVKEPTKEEQKMRLIARRSIVASIDIREGQLITEDAVNLKRPGTGIQPRELSLLIGKRATRDIKRDEVLTWDMVK